MSTATLPDAAAVLPQARNENFPVASRLLPRRERADLMALYGFARLVDDIGDEYGGDRLAALDWLETELQATFDGRAQHPLMLKLQTTVSERQLSQQPFERLIAANRRDQQVTRYQSWEQLLQYCELSANPVGELVLEVFGLATPERVVLSDAVCTALQVVEHLQDVGEDFARGRVYLPADDLARFGASESDLAGGETADALRGVVALQVARVRGLLDRGGPLVATLRGRPRLAIAAFVGGGRAALEAIARGDCRVLPRAPRPTRAMRALAFASSLSGR